MAPARHELIELELVISTNKKSFGVRQFSDYNG